ncbi:hypothetical protein ACFVWG_21765 [Kribbella sp. NPDC058245]|uniref:hypothetical protein n=1 Tax=Kribbella sp. NPDC058245 TaxID=3346399 RepID=UPI0036E0B470
MNTEETPARGDGDKEPWRARMWLETAGLLGASLALRPVEDIVPTVVGVAIGVLRPGLLVGFYWRSAVWAERVARRKEIYHPQYFVLGPIGLVMALVARDGRAVR